MPWSGCNFSTVRTLFCKARFLFSEQVMGCILYFVFLDLKYIHYFNTGIHICLYIGILDMYVGLNLNLDVGYFILSSPITNARALVILLTVIATTPKPTPFRMFPG